MENAAHTRRGRPPGIRTAEGELTSRQAAIGRCITEAVRRQAYPPSMREIGQAVHLASTSAVAHQLMALERKRVLYRDPHRPRAYRVRPSWAPDLDGRSEAPVDVPLVGRISAGAPLLAEEMIEDVYTLPRQFCVNSERVTGDAPGVVQAPLVGRIAAGPPITAEENIEELMLLPRSLVGAGEMFVLTVAGDSMSGASILDGDLVTVLRQPTAEHGDIVAALVDGEATVKRLKREGTNVWLMPENEQYEPLWGNEAAVIGKVVAVMRRL
ncbi:transcriptional repressor LexA [Streptomyces sp. NPDC058255]|uniref:transcriptional repressor LexA n=1 Tax=Streptomyces sp. NPDC058255 TaxID=3346407 RepID=UPI0036E9A2DC